MTTPLSRPWDQNGRTALGHYGMSPDCELRLLSLSENATYLVTPPDEGPPYVLRLHRPGYRTPAQIRSEIAWIRALRGSGAVRTPEVFDTLGGESVSCFADDEGREQNAVLFEYVAGHEAPDDNLVAAQRAVGEIAGALRNHTARWRPPPAFERPRWGIETAIGVDGQWGYWQRNPYVGAREAELLGRVDARIRQGLAMYGRLDGRIGLIHGDMRLANLLVSAGELVLIDFDDCGFGWHLYELACALTLIENHPQVEAISAAWIDGYRQFASVDRHDLEAIPDLVMLRRMLLVGWLATHSHTKEARQMAETFVPETTVLAESYLSGRYLAHLA